MIISHKHKFIFFKSAKAAGTSVQVFLAAYCGEDDMISPIGESVADWYKPGNTRGIHKHAFADEIYHAIDKNQFRDYFKFTTVRHPIDKMISLYNWWNEKQEFNYFIQRCKFPQRATFFHPFYSMNGSIITDDLIRHESLERDLKRICGKIGLEYDSKYLLHYKKRERSIIEINKASVNIIKKRFNREYEDLGYADFRETQGGVRTYPEDWRAVSI